MNKTEFLDLLRYYFRNAKTEELNDILADYEAHFEEGKRAGLTEEEISKELGSPKDIYESFQSEGMVEEKEKTSPFADNMKEIAGEARVNAVKAAGKAKDAAGKTWDEVSPRIPCVLGNTASFSARLLSVTCTVLAVLVAAATALFIGLTWVSVPPFPGMPHLPMLHPITTVFLSVSGLFTALSIYFVGQEGSRAFRDLAAKAQGKPADKAEEENDAPEAPADGNEEPKPAVPEKTAEGNALKGGEEK